MNKSTQTLVLKYFHSWQEPADLEEMRECLAADLYINSGFFRFETRDAFIEFLEQNHAPWKEVKLISGFYYEGEAAFVYEGINIVNEKKMRVAELLEIADGRIKRIDTVISASD